jgi:uncharacterized 2Fe-2S/4Fe-4S cluster protein (DUF4445 family)
MTSLVEVRVISPDGDDFQGTANVSVGGTLLDAAMAAGADISATCGRRGRCRSCRVKIISGDAPPPTLQDRLQLGHDEVQEQFRLACQTQVIGPCEIMVAPPRTETGHQILAGTGDADVGNLDICSGVQKMCIKAVAPMDENSQSTDLQEILNKLPDTTEAPTSLAVLRQIPSVLREDGGRLTVTTFANRITHVESGDTTEHMYGMAFDIGTTSVVGTLVDLISGEELASVGNINPQAVHGGDLMSRIAFAQFDEKNLATLRGEILNAINGYVAEACEKASIAVDHVYKMVIVGNTCMHHIFLGIDTSHVGLAPYAPVLSGSIVLPSSELPLKRAPNAIVCLLPIIAGFVGADTTAAILATKIHQSPNTRCLVDIGTNGEVVMGSKGRLMACSAPAGPALEGGQIHQGMRAAIGAIEKVHIDDDIHLGVIGDTKPIGICGSGLIDAIASMMDAELIDGAGRLRNKDFDQLPENLQIRFKSKDGTRSMVLASKEESGTGEEIILTQMDIRQLQLAKAAIYAGIVMLQTVMNVSNSELHELYVCGGFGNYINMESAIKIRLVPNLPLERVSYFGNAALMGAQIALLSEAERANADEIVHSVEHVALATHPAFQEIFVEACNLANIDLKEDRKKARQKVQNVSAT